MNRMICTYLLRKFSFSNVLIRLLPLKVKKLILRVKT